MSLINDALKRASQSQKKPAPPDSSGGAPMLPADSPREKSFPLFVPILVAIIFLGVGSLLWRWAHNRESAAPETAAKSPGPVASLPEPRLSTPAAPQSRIEISTNLVTRPIPIARPPATTVSAPPVESRPIPKTVPLPVAAEPAPVAVTVPTPATFPPMKLQAVFYRLRNPTVLINGKTLSKGDEVDGARVMEIERMSVVVDWNGEKKTLRIEAP